MTVYVDELVFYTTDEMKPAARHLGDREWCHMYAATEADLPELHVMAEQLGLKRAYFQDHHRWQFKHYDLTAAKRARAIYLGAVEIGAEDRARQTIAQLDAETAERAAPDTETTARLMTDAELVAFLRQRFTGLIRAVVDFELCLIQTSPERDAGIRRILDTSGLPAVVADRLNTAIMGHLKGETNRLRAEAWRAVRDAGALTFAEAIQATPDMTDEQRAYWLDADRTVDQ